jgi:enoyl-CoA hydratase/carnithine racemase
MMDEAWVSRHHPLRAPRDPPETRPMTYATLEAARHGTAFVITLKRPERRNALSRQAAAEIIDAAQRGEADTAARAVIITGGPDFFSAGADLTEAIQVGSADAPAYFRNFHRLAEVLETLQKPVLAAIEGFCFTGGLELALACDIRIGAEGSSYAITSARIGTVAGAGGTQRLPRIVGAAHALEMLFAAEPIDAAEAYRIGLINRLTPKGGALTEAKRMAELYATRGPLSHALMKRTVHQGLQVDLKAGLELEIELATRAYGTKDKQEGISAFLEKRQASFKGE